MRKTYRTTSDDFSPRHQRFQRLDEEAFQAGCAYVFSLPADRVVICTVVRGEIRHGIEQLSQGKRRQNLESQAKPLFAVIPCEPVPETAADHYARIKVTRQQKGLVLDENGLWIAATALALGATLITRDSDFQHIEGLSVNDWTA